MMPKSGDPHKSEFTYIRLLVNCNVQVFSKMAVRQLGMDAGKNRIVILLTRVYERFCHQDASVFDTMEWRTEDLISSMAVPKVCGIFEYTSR